MTTDEKIALLEARITQLELEVAKPAPKPELGYLFQRMISDDRGRDFVVTVGGNN